LIPIAHARIRAALLSGVNVGPKLPSERPQMPLGADSDARGREAELGERIEARLAEIEQHYLAGSYSTVPTELDKLLAAEEPSESQLIELFRLKGFAYVALGMDELAVKAFHEILAHKPELVFDEALVSPKIRAVLERARQMP